MTAKRLFVGIGSLLVVGLLIALIASGGVDTPGRAAQRSAPPARQAVTALVEKRTLVDEVVTRGTVRSAGALEYTAPATGGGARVEVLFAPGDTVDAGDVAALVDSRPVLILQGDGQLGADVGPMSTGRDVDRLQTGLRSLGLDIPESESGVVGSATRSAIEALYKSGGFMAETTAEPTGVISSGGESLEAKRSRLRRAVDEAGWAVAAAEASVNNAADPVGPARMNLENSRRKIAEAEAARQAAVDSATIALEAARRSDSESDDEPNVQPSAVVVAQAALRDAKRIGDASISDARAQASLAELQLDEAKRQAAVAAASADLQLRSARSALAAAREALAEAERHDGLVVPRAEILFVPQLPTTVLSVGSSPASGASSGPLFTLRSGELIVDVDMPTGARGESDASGVAESDDGTVVVAIAEAGPAAMTDADEPRPPGGAGAGATTRGTSFKITSVTRGEAVAGMNLRVTLSTPITTEDVLAVPLRAIVTGDDGRGHVRVRDSRVGDNNGFRRVDVRVGRSGGGMVEVTDPGGGPLTDLVPGDEVRVS